MKAHFETGVVATNRRNFSTCKNLGDGKPACHRFRMSQQAESVFRTTF